MLKNSQIVHSLRYQLSVTTAAESTFLTREPNINAHSLEGIFQSLVSDGTQEYINFLRNELPRYLERAINNGKHDVVEVIITHYQQRDEPIPVTAFNSFHKSGNIFWVRKRQSESFYMFHQEELSYQLSVCDSKEIARVLLSNCCSDEERIQTVVEAAVVSLSVKTVGVHQFSTEISRCLNLLSSFFEEMSDDLNTLNILVNERFSNILIQAFKRELRWHQAHDRDCAESHNDFSGTVSSSHGNRYIERVLFLKGLLEQVKQLVKIDHLEQLSKWVIDCNDTSLNKAFAEVILLTLSVTPTVGDHTASSEGIISKKVLQFLAKKFKKEVFSLVSDEEKFSLEQRRNLIYLGQLDQSPLCEFYRTPRVGFSAATETYQRNLELYSSMSEKSALVAAPSLGNGEKTRDHLEKTITSTHLDAEKSTTYHPGQAEDIGQEDEKEESNQRDSELDQSRRQDLIVAESRPVVAESRPVVAESRPVVAESRPVEQGDAVLFSEATIASLLPEAPTATPWLSATSQHYVFPEVPSHPIEIPSHAIEIVNEEEDGELNLA